VLKPEFMKTSTSESIMTGEATDETKEGADSASFLGYDSSDDNDGGMDTCAATDEVADFVDYSETDQEEQGLQSEEVYSV
jgi:hypothetical protein